MSPRTWAAVPPGLAPIWFNTWFAVLAKRFEYPDVLRRPPAEVLSRFRDGGSGLILTWWAFMLSGLLLIPTIVAVGKVVVPHRRRPDRGRHRRGRAGGAGADARPAAVGLPGAMARSGRTSRPNLRSSARSRSRSRRSTGSLGVGVGEHLGYLLTGLWSVLFGFALDVQHRVVRVVRLGGDRDRPRADGGVAGVPRPQRGARLDARGLCGAVPLHRVVALAARDGRRAPGVTRGGVRSVFHYLEPRSTYWNTQAEQRFIGARMTSKDVGSCTRKTNSASPADVHVGGFGNGGDLDVGEQTRLSRSSRRGH